MASDESSKPVTLDYATPQKPGVVSAVVASLATPPGWFLHIITFAVFATTLWDGVAPGGTWGVLGVLLVLSWLLLLAVWLIRLLFFAVSRKRTGVRRARHLFVVPLLLLLALLLRATQLPLMVGFWISRSAMEQLAQAALQGQKTPTRAGIYSVEVRVVAPGVVRFRVPDGAAMFDDAGFLYSPQAPDQQLRPPGSRRTTYRSLGGSWYVWRTSGG